MFVFNSQPKRKADELAISICYLGRRANGLHGEFWGSDQPGARCNWSFVCSWLQPVSGIPLPWFIWCPNVCFASVLLSFVFLVFLCFVLCCLFVFFLRLRVLATVFVCSYSDWPTPQVIAILIRSNPMLFVLAILIPSSLAMAIHSEPLNIFLAIVHNVSLFMEPLLGSPAFHLNHSWSLKGTPFSNRCKMVVSHWCVDHRLTTLTNQSLSWPDNI